MNNEVDTEQPLEKLARYLGWLTPSRAAFCSFCQEVRLYHTSN